MSDFHLKYRDTRPIMDAFLKNPDGSEHDLTGSVSWTLHIWLKGGGKLERTMDMVAPATQGLVRYAWAAADWTTPDDSLVVGQHRMEVEVVAGSGRLTFPNFEYDDLHIIDDIGQKV